MKKVKILFLIVSMLLLSGCGTYYFGTVDSLRDYSYNLNFGDTYFLQPASPKTPQNDLLFKTIIESITPAFTNQGWLVTSDKSKATHLAKISYYSKKPTTEKVTLTSETITPIVNSYGNITQIVKLEEQRVENRTTYRTTLLIEGYLLQNNTEVPIWRTEITTSSQEDNIRAMLDDAAIIARGALAVQTKGLETYTISFDDKGNMSIDHN